MELDEKTYQEYETVLRYKRSILLDDFIVILIFAPIFFLCAKYVNSESDFYRPVFIMVYLLFFSAFFLSDKIFKGASLGKRIYKICLVSKIKNRSASISSTVYRRFLEIWIHPLMTKMNFLEKSRYIDNKTGTKIIKSN